MALDLRLVPNFALRRARQGHWEAQALGACAACGEFVMTNVLELCSPCNFQQKIRSLTFIAEPWGLKEVRRQYGHAGEADRNSAYVKAKKHEADEEKLANTISLDEYKQRVSKELGVEL